MKKSICMVVLIVLSMLLSSCSTPELSVSTKTDKSQTVSIAWAESDSTQVEVMYQYVMPALQEAFPNVKFSYAGITTDKAEALRTMSAAGNLPDIYCSDSAIYEMLLRAGNLVDLAPFLTAEDWLDEHYRAPEKLYLDGKLYFITCGQNDYYSPVIYYNRDLFLENGLSEPQTVDELLVACRTLRTQGLDPITLCAQDAAGFFLDSVIESYDPTLLRQLRTGQAEWTDAEVLQALSLVDTLEDADAFSPGTAKKTQSECLEEFISEQAAMWPAMSWNNLQVAAAPFEVGEFLFPSANSAYPTGSHMLTWGSAYGGWAVNPEAADVELCIRVLKVLLHAEAQRHADCGLQENYVVSGAVQPKNELEHKRMNAYDNAAEHETLLFLSAMDDTTASGYLEAVQMLFSDDRDYHTTDFAADFSVFWKRNTRCGVQTDSRS